MSPSKISTAATSDSTHCALVFGATGVTGWGLCKNLLAHHQPDDPTSKPFDTVIGVCEQSIEGINMFIKDDRFRLIAGANLLQGEDAVIDTLKDVSGIQNVSHVFYVGEFLELFLKRVESDYEI
jgi:nucleoside-diphosphate-sugar epimerase